MGSDPLWTLAPSPKLSSLELSVPVASLEIWEGLRAGLLTNAKG